MRLLLILVSAALLAQAPPPAALQLTGTGVQIYTCTPSGTNYAWKFTAPEATLIDASGRTVGKHFAGPTWQSTDGSTVIGEAVATDAAPQPGNIPWLVLRAKSHTGEGSFSHIAYLTRTDTKGGLAPASGCDAAHAQSQTRVPYSATYTLFPTP